MKRYRIDIKVKIILILICMIGCSVPVFSQNYKKVIDLNNRWKFSIGDNAKWASPDFDDSAWDRISVPSAWENQGFYGYDGFAWYRTTFTKPEEVKGQSFFLRLGNIDDVDEVFLNGQRIGKSGNFPPYYSTAYNSSRMYFVSAESLKQVNTLAVRVYDDIGEGGIIHGDIALVADLDAIPLDVNLQGTWKFKPGKYAHEDIQHLNDWKEIIVPGFWENQGYKDYDGYACYALEFEVKKEAIADRMVLLLGKIDDIDQVYLNGVLVGQSGDFKPSTVAERSNSYQQMRGYYLPENLVQIGKKNLLVVKVYDELGGGGIYTGTIGLISQNHYIQYWKNRRRR